MTHAPNHDETSAAHAPERRAAAGWAAIAAGLALTFGAGVALWASEGGKVFAETAFAALVACF